MSGARGDAGVVVREATADESLAVRRVLDAAMLETDAVDGAVERGDAFVAAVDDRVVGALVLVPVASVDGPDELDGCDGMHVDAVAVTHRRRGQGVGRALVDGALERERRLSVAFDPSVGTFYDALGFETVVQADADGRAWAVQSLDV
ncbi:GNAT family N-acetyltransferase [Halorubellus sp. JP-L1]|uniref:GNAT family N-acetyltransferase n=1 Tax=Halorubellus sp. JP-L1 TaxID=2715753 RepID=UPI00140BDB26|nr:GNAT family N-acetyltransferase [Halorubellus sp. JP-L1]NHN43462.1 GNAT family N-acetyltransferase [Halorubellus sp. JP-L1]